MVCIVAFVVVLVLVRGVGEVTAGSLWAVRGDASPAV